MNPEHMEVVDHATNMRRGHSVATTNAAKTHCPHGHEYAEDNIYWDQGKRICRACKLKRQAAKRAEARREREAALLERGEE